MTSATDELRRLLDERGVEYKTDDRQIVRYTDWGQWFFSEPLDAEPNTLGAQCELVCMPVTPAKAVDATLGRGTCHIGRGTSGLMHVTTGHCSECGAEVVKPARYCPNCGRKVVG